MHRNKRQLRLLILGLFFLCALLYLVFSFSPKHILEIEDWKISVIFVFFTLLFPSLFFLVSYLLKNKTQGSLIALFITSFLALRMLDLIQPFFVILLVILFAALEFFFLKRI